MLRALQARIAIPLQSHCSRASQSHCTALRRFNETDLDDSSGTRKDAFECFLLCSSDSAHPAESDLSDCRALPIVSRCWMSKVAQLVNVCAPDDHWRQAGKPRPSFFLFAILSYTYRKVWDRLHSSSQPLCAGVQALQLEHDRSGREISERRNYTYFQLQAP